ncbi:MAG: DUF362 domain-containing protein [Desulfobacteraceae bacterium]|nr:DUF362 domain-containing protein [Desulfobacteraceae bacterium]
MTSKVWHMGNRSTSPNTSYVASMVELFEAAGFQEMIKPHDVVAIKLHCGEWNNTAYLRPVYARALADKIKSLGGRPFVTDTTTLTYNPNPGRSTELDMRITAERNGYTSEALGCPFIVADGWSGTDDVRIDLPEGYILKEAFIAKAIAHADVLIALTHFKGHPLGVVGGSLKNLGIGAQSKRGKHNVHMGGHPKYGLGAATEFHPERCKGKNECPMWERCNNCCPYGLFHVKDDTVEWEREKCTGCLAHLGVNLGCGVFNLPKEPLEMLHPAIADACLATVNAVGKGKVGFINMAIDISPWCDCVNYADTPLVPNLGVFASQDPVALDKACLDKVGESHGTPGSQAEDIGVADPGVKKLETAAAIMPGMSEEAQINTGELIGLGSKEYELVKVTPSLEKFYGFTEDTRSIGPRFKNLYEKEDPFPRDRYDGQGFKRADDVDYEKVK